MTNRIRIYKYFDDIISYHMCMYVYVIMAAMAAITAESVVKAICESSGDGSAYENETEDCGQRTRCK